MSSATKTKERLDAATCSAYWVSIETPPPAAGSYIVGNTSHGYVGQARWMPRKAEWKFPSAQSAFRADVWTVFPSLPNAEILPPAEGGATEAKKR